MRSWCEICVEEEATRYGNVCDGCYNWAAEVAEMQNQAALEYSYMEVDPPQASPDLNSDDLVIPF